MNRRELLAVAAATALSGCASSSDDPGTTTESATTAADWAEPTGDSHRTTLPPYKSSIEIYSRTEKAYVLSFSLSVLDTDETVYEEQRTVEPDDSFSLDPHVSERTSYRLAVRRFGEKLFELSVYPYERYELAVKRGPEIEVESLVEV